MEIKNYQRTIMVNACAEEAMKKISQRRQKEKSMPLTIYKQG